MRFELEFKELLWHLTTDDTTITNWPSKYQDFRSDREHSENSGFYFYMLAPDNDGVKRLFPLHNISIDGESNKNIINNPNWGEGMFVKRDENGVL